MKAVSESEYLTTIESLKKRFKVAAQTEDWLGLPLVIFRAGGREEPPVLVTAGSSGLEVAGVYAALELVLQVDVERTVYILPSRDPTGFHDASFVLSRIAGANLHVESVEDLRRVAIEAGAELVVDTNDLLLALFKGVGVAASSSADAYTAAAILEREIRSRGLAETLDNTRVLIAAQLPHVEGVGELGRFHTVFLKEGRVLTYDYFDAETVPEVEFVKDFIRRENLGMVIDLHESKCSAFYVAQSEAPSSDELTILYLVLDQVQQYGLGLADRSALESMGLNFTTEGAGYGKGLCGLADYASREIFAFAFYTPLEAPLESRIRTLTVASLSALNAFAVVKP